MKRRLLFTTISALVLLVALWMSSRRLDISPSTKNDFPPVHSTRSDDDVDDTIRPHLHQKTDDKPSAARSTDSMVVPPGGLGVRGGEGGKGFGSAVAHLGGGSVKDTCPRCPKKVEAPTPEQVTRYKAAHPVRSAGFASPETPEETAKRQQEAIDAKKAALERLLSSSTGTLNLLGGGGADGSNSGSNALSSFDGTAAGIGGAVAGTSYGAAGRGSAASGTPGKSTGDVVVDDIPDRFARIIVPDKTQTKPTGSAPTSGSPLSDLGRHPPDPNAKKTTYDFEDDVIEGDMIRPGLLDAQPASPPPIERYPNIEAPDTVTLGQEIAVQVSLTSDQIAPETKIVSGAQHDGKLQLQMATGENQWTLTVNLTAPGMVFSRGSNTADITIKRDGDSTVAAFYLRPAAEIAIPELHQETKILATLLHDGAFLARLSRPLTIVNSKATATGSSTATVAAAATPRPAVLAAPAATQAPSPKPSIQIDPDLTAPGLTILENRVGDTLRVTFITPHTTPVEADIPDPDKLHDWISAHYAQMATQGRGAALDPATSQNGSQTDAQYKADYIRGFGSELYDKFAPQAFKDLFWRLYDNSRNHAPDNKNATWLFESIQVLSDDPAIPWELMRPARADGTDRTDFLGLHFMIARWPLGRHGAARPPQSLVLRQSAVIAPTYQGARQLQSAGEEMATLKKMEGFTQVSGNYAAVRDLAMHPPQGIVHFAGHGAVLEKSGAPQFAILLQDTEMDPATWQSLGQSAGSTTHPLYFFNACDVGQSQRFMNDVDGWAPMLLSGGASGYIGALWPVGDSTAEAVAASFYTKVSMSVSGSYGLGRSNVAEALTSARADVFAKTSDPTALAYVFYGDPYLVLTNSLDRRGAYSIPQN